MYFKWNFFLVFHIDLVDLDFNLIDFSLFQIIELVKILKVKFYYEGISEIFLHLLI